MQGKTQLIFSLYLHREADGSLASNLGAAIFRGAKTKKRGLPSTDHLYKQVIINRFQILHVLGKGSFGEVRAGKEN